MPEISSQDLELIDAARAIIKERFKADYHEIGAALRTTLGRVFCAVHLEATVGRIAVCAEAVALGMAAASGDTQIDTVVAVNSTGAVVAPCGMCRELMADYASAAQIIVPHDTGLMLISVVDLLPHKYHG